MKHKKYNFTTGISQDPSKQQHCIISPPPALLPKEQGKMASKFLLVNNGSNHKGVSKLTLELKFVTSIIRKFHEKTGVNLLFYPIFIFFTHPSPSHADD